MQLGDIRERGLKKLHKRNSLQGVESSKLDFYKHCVFGKQSIVQLEQKESLTTFIQMFVVGGSSLKGRFSLFCKHH
jgi:hypothetical protein